MRLDERWTSHLKTHAEYSRRFVCPARQPFASDIARIWACRSSLFTLIHKLEFRSRSTTAGARTTKRRSIPTQATLRILCEQVFSRESATTRIASGHHSRRLIWSLSPLSAKRMKTLDQAMQRTAGDKFSDKFGQRNCVILRDPCKRRNCFL